MKPKIKVVAVLTSGRTLLFAIIIVHHQNDASIVIAIIFYQYWIAGCGCARTQDGEKGAPTMARFRIKKHRCNSQIFLCAHPTQYFLLKY